MRNLTRAALAGVATFAFGASALVAPQTIAQEDTIPETTAQTTTTKLDVPLACNLQLKSPGIFTRAVEGVYNVGSQKRDYQNFRFGADVTAPETVEVGEEFEYVIDFGALELPAVIRSAVTANVSKASQINLWVDLPENAEVVSMEPEAGNDAVSVTRDGNRIHFSGKESADVTAWSMGTRGEFGHGGLEATKGTGADGKDAFLAELPKVTLTLKAPETAGEEIRPSFDSVDANDFAPESFLQMYADAAAIGIDANGFIRCGLSEDDSVLENSVAVPFAKFPAVKVVEPGEPTDPEDTKDPEDTTDPVEPKDSRSSVPEIDVNSSHSSISTGSGQSSISAPWK